MKSKEKNGAELLPLATCQAEQQSEVNTTCSVNTCLPKCFRKANGNKCQELCPTTTRWRHWVTTHLPCSFKVASFNFTLTVSIITILWSKEKKRMKVVRADWIKYEVEGNVDFECRHLLIPFNWNSLLQAKCVPTFSIDIHPDGSKVATGGQGANSGLVVIWNMLPIKSLEAELDTRVPKIFAAFECHYHSVFIVRWSNSGNLLASAGDDRRINIWTLSERYSDEGSSPTGPYYIVSTLSIQSGVILDLSWSPDDLFLSSYSSKNCLQVWSGTTYTETHSLTFDCPLYNGHYWDSQTCNLLSEVGQFLIDSFIIMYLFSLS